MFEYENRPEAENKTDYTGLIIALALAPVFLLFAVIDKPDMGLAVCMVLAMILLAVKIRWRLRKQVWFWVILGFIFVLHVPLFLIVRWPQGNLPTIFYTLPLGIADFVLITGALGLAEKLFSNE